ncbi:hypothetical protein K435DRAFT_860334 [Dendrothele bispora CBS 962.96]|uniref:Uncharacterized protein n=1 Tax=Dendrothele bispora (strain CBS 962.96) TaxID=1314807 RepID=A0A4S8LYH3_DENBC|nr:hypothetical protein K435DRAFT_860334 [Dendrothele bispora CBS 962.96]
MEYLEAVQKCKEEEAKGHEYCWGRPVKDLVSVSPSLGLGPEFMYLHSFLCLDQNIPPLQLCPNSNTTPPPEGFTFPKAPVYYWNKTSDLRFPHGYFYSCSVSTDQAHKDAENAHLNHVVSPPGVIPAGYNQVRQSFDMDPIQSMIKMPPGTMELLSFYHEFPRIRFLVDSLWLNTWGNRHELPFYKLGLQHNARSSKPVEGSAAGSYSLGVTVGEGQGKGIVQPAVQLTTPAFVLRHHRLLVTLHELFRLIVPLCISKLEWDITNARAEELNVFCTGGLAPAHSSIQKNVSPGRKGGSLIAFIGIIQGKWHSDSKDDKNRWTLLVVFLCIPPGSAAGDFLLA